MLKRALSPFSVVSVKDEGLTGVKNGKLLNEIEGRFDVLITADKNLRYQQNLTNRKLAIVELPFNSWKRLAPLVDHLKQCLSSIRPGQYVELK